MPDQTPENRTPKDTGRAGAERPSWGQDDPSGAGVRIRVKVVPGAKRDGLAGVLGDRLKVRVAAPPEQGRANAAVVALLCEVLGVRASRVRLVMGASSPEKELFVEGLTACQAGARVAARGA